MRIIQHQEGQVIYRWLAPEKDFEERELKKQIYKSLSTQGKTTLSEADFMQDCSYSSDGVFVYTAPPDSQEIHVCMAIRGQMETHAIEPPGSWHA